jgi:hypothetical protein
MFAEAAAGAIITAFSEFDAKDCIGKDATSIIHVRDFIQLNGFVLRVGV